LFFSKILFKIKYQKKIRSNPIPAERGVSPRAAVSRARREKTFKEI
jgi:hypothetical protein